MKIPRYARYDYVSKKASEFLTQYEINSFPLNPFAIIAQEHWGLQSYSELMAAFNCDAMQVCKCLRSKDGYTQYDETNYTIAYNDVEKAEGRVRFTLMHEIGHIYLNHLIDFDKARLYRGGLTKAEDKVLENEANAFARNVLAPAPVVEQLNRQHWRELVLHFGISKDAAIARLDFLHEDKRNLSQLGLTSNILKRFMNFFNEKNCTTCGHTFCSSNASYCPICGHKTLKWGEGKLRYIKYMYNTDEDGKLTICPRCQNDDIQIGPYCPICGNGLVNRCDHYEGEYNHSQSGCGKILAPNARYCPDCGLPSSFFENKAISGWEDELEEIESSKSDVTLDDLTLIRNEWEKIILNIGGAIRSSFRNTIVEPAGENTLCIVFEDPNTFAIGNRPTALGEIEQYVKTHYGKVIFFKARICGNGQKTDYLAYKNVPDDEYEPLPFN